MKTATCEWAESGSVEIQLSDGQRLVVLDTEARDIAIQLCTMLEIGDWQNLPSIEEGE